MVGQRTLKKLQVAEHKEKGSNPFRTKLIKIYEKIKLIILIILIFGVIITNLYTNQEFQEKINKIFEEKHFNYKIKPIKMQKAVLNGNTTILNLYKMQTTNI